MRITEAELQRILHGRVRVAPAGAAPQRKAPACHRCQRTDGELVKTGGDNRLWAHPDCALKPLPPPAKSARRVLLREGD